jgi:4-hydroxymandelate oxidase
MNKDDGKTIINLRRLKEPARERLTKMAFDFIAGGAEDEKTLHANERAWETIKLLPRVLRGAPQRKLETNLFGATIDFPILMAPMGFQRLVHPEGEVASAVGAAKAGTIFVLSTTSTRSIEEVAKASQGTKWFQLYVYRDRAITQNLVERAVAAGYKAICLTVDNPIEGRRERDKINQFVLPPGIKLANFSNVQDLKNVDSNSNESALTTYIEKEWETGLSWQDVEWVASLSKLPLLIKGIMSPQDADLAIQHGAAGIIVSNHGGRQLDGAAASAEALSDVVKSVAGRCPVLVDGGIRRGTHVLKALALGADAVLVGRPLLWGLALNGSDGVTAVLQHLRKELSEAMELAGCRELAEISAELLWKAS